MSCPVKAGRSRDPLSPLLFYDMAEDKKSFRIPLYSGLLTDGHPARIGGAIWVFLWMIDRTTEEKEIEIEGKTEKLGVVLGGVPVLREKIAEDLKTSVVTVHRNLAILEKEKYLVSKRSAHGKAYFVRKSKKWEDRSIKSDTSTLPAEVSKVIHHKNRSIKSDTSNKPEVSDVIHQEVSKVIHHNTSCNKLPELHSTKEPPKPPLLLQGSESDTPKTITASKFEQIWKRYPKKIEKPLALERFQKSVITEKNWEDINKALDNYLAYLEEERHGDFYPVKNGSVWFRDKNWKSWIDWVSAKQATQVIPEDVRAVIDIWKEINGFQGVTGWDETFAADCIQPAEKLLKMAEGNTGLIREALASIKRYFAKSKLSWKMSTAVEWFPRYLAEQ